MVKGLAVGVRNTCSWCASCCRGQVGEGEVGGAFGGLHLPMVVVLGPGRVS